MPRIPPTEAVSGEIEGAISQPGARFEIRAGGQVALRATRRLDADPAAGCTRHGRANVTIPVS
ncbi:MAG TPA: hypothetical protein VGM80_12980, partial [Gaiellaceae bacterium]